ncbi:MAG: M48 family metalloprotease [Chloroflexota bacterium]|nr:M48 family metalloprotease [Chloroflexota bacterium]
MEIGTTQPQQAELDINRQKQARHYSRIQRRLGLVEMAIAVVGIIFIFWLNLDIELRNILQGVNWQPLAGWYPIQLLLYVLILMLVYRIITLPFSYYGGFILPHRYGLSTMTTRGWIVDLVKGLVLELVFEIGAFEVIYVLLATQPQTWWLWVALVFLFFSVVMANLAPVLLFPIFYKFTPLPEGELTERLLNLAKRAHTRVQGVFTMHLSDKTTAANAALMGLGNTRRIVLGDTMLDRYTPDEIEVVLAHELGHQVHHDIWKLLISQSIVTLGGLYLLNLALHWAADTWHRYTHELRNEVLTCSKQR